MVIANSVVGKSDQVRTLRPDGKKGISISADLYEKISGVIFRQIKTSEEVTLVNIIEEARNYVANEKNGELIILHVKLDMEAKGYLETTQSRVSRNRGLLRVTGKGRKYFRERSSSAG